jgi:hypothetical protein
MITKATIVRTNAFADREPPAGPPHGDPDLILTGRDIVAFGKSPLRWKLAQPEVDTPRVTLAELGHAVAMADGPRSHCFVRRPDTMEALRNTCPKCESRSAAKICRTCGVARRNVVVRVPFSSAVPECAQWIKGHEAQRRVTLTGHTFDEGLDIGTGLLADPVVADIKKVSEHLVLIQGIWHDLDTATDIPIEAMIDLVPRDGTEWDQCLCAIDVTTDATPNPWAQRAQHRGLHVRAALAQMLHAAATGEPRSKYTWLLVESGGGHMTGRRQASAEMLSEGRSALRNLLNAYAKCLKSGVWPAFDPPPEARTLAFTEVHLEPWMIDPQQGGAAYYAVSAGRVAPQSAPVTEPAPPDGD